MADSEKIMKAIPAVNGFIGASALIVSLGCGSPRRSEPIKGAVVAVEASQERGKIVFMQNCNRCHPGGEAGLGPALNGLRGPKALQRRRVRHGPGRMPSFDKTQISDEQLEELLSYLALLRSHGSPAGTVDGFGQGGRP